MRKILIIEDDIVIQETICDILEVEGYEVETASNGYDGLRVSNQYEPDLIICDVNMPLMNGYDTIKKFRESTHNLMTPFLFLSALTRDDQIRTGMNLGADDYITKPFKHTDLLDAIKRLLRKYALLKEYYKERQEERIHDGIIKFKHKVRSKFQGYLDSLNHANTIQRAVLPKRKELNKLFPGHGLFHAPKDIVSGDFYWAKQIGNKRLVAVGDCTGHGIPAALITMVCSNMLSVSVNKFGLTRPKDILEKTNELVIEFMDSNGTILNHGMDIILCSVDYDNKTLLFAGAKRPLYYISEELDIKGAVASKVNEYSLNSKSLFRVKGGVESIGTKAFHNSTAEQIIRFKKNDTVYLTSDGFYDQFGGSRGKKYNAKRFVNLLGSIKDKSPERQESCLKETFLEWKGTTEQTDDVTVFLLKF